MKANKLITRRQALVSGLASVGGLMLSGCSTKVPPSYGNILRMGDALTYAARQTLLPGQSLVKEYTHKNISSFPAIGTTDPGNPNNPQSSEKFRELQRGGFVDWRVSIEGLVSRPGTYSLADLQRFPSRTQITRHACEEGWSAIAEWTGVPLSTVLKAAGIQPEAKFVILESTDGWWDSLDMADTLHPQTLLAYRMNGAALPVPHGAPVRLRVERQLGYKNLKYVARITVTDTVKDWGKGQGAQGAENGYSWYAGI